MTNAYHNHNKAINTDIAETIGIKKQEKLLKIFISQLTILFLDRKSKEFDKN